MRDFKRNEVLEICPVIILSSEDADVIEETMLTDYYFIWQRTRIAICLGYGSLFNHSYTPNATFKRDFKNSVIIFRTVKPIKKGEEICTNYNGNTKDQSKVWFHKN